jgi:hypothetical protein
VALINSNPAILRAAIVDAGTNGNRLAKWLKSVGVRQIPAIVLTHNHNDHIRGVADLVEAYAGKVGKLYYVIDQPPAKIPFWLPIQQWLEKKKIAAAVKVCPEDASEPTHGKPLLPQGLDGFQLYCVYPTEIELAGVAQAAPLLGTNPGANNPNAASAILLQGGEFNANGGAGRIDRHHPYVREAVTLSTKRAGLASPSRGNAVAEMVGQILEERLDEWLAQAQNRTGGSVLGYRDARDEVTVPLLRPPGLGSWDNFTCLNSLRDVEPTVNLILDDRNIDEDPNFTLVVAEEEDDQEQA